MLSVSIHRLALSLLLVSSVFPPLALADPSQDSQDFQDSREILHFGLISLSSPQSLIKLWQPLLKDMGESIGVSVASTTFDEYAGVVWAMGAGNVQIAWMGNKSAIEAVDRAGGEVAFQGIDTSGSVSYFSHLIVGASTGLTSEQDVFARGFELTFGDGDPNSTSGHVIPGYYLFTQRGLDPRAIFKRVVENNHEKNFLDVAEGRIEVATITSSGLKRFKAMYPGKADAVRIVWTSPPIPSDPIVWRRDLPESIKERIRVFLLGYGRETPDKSPARIEHERAVLASMNRSGFIQSDNRQLIPIREIVLRRARSRIEVNSAISAEDRERKLKRIDDKLQQVHAR